MTAPEQTGTGNDQQPPSVPRTRTGSAWVAAIVAALILILLLVFILQNSQRVKVSFLGTDGSLPLGVALLLAAASGLLLVAVPGTARILQLRRAANRALAQPLPEPVTMVKAPAVPQPSTGDRPTADDDTGGTAPDAAAPPG